MDWKVTGKAQTKMKSSFMKDIQKEGAKMQTLEIPDLKLLGPSKLSSLWFGIESDDYLTYAIKSKS